MVFGACAGSRHLRHRPAFDSSPRAQTRDLVVAGCYFAGVAALAGRTPGQAVLSPRVVEDHTYRRPGWRALLIRWFVLQVPHLLMLAVSASSSVRKAMTALEGLQPEADELRRRYGRDRRQHNDSLLDLYESRAVDPWAAGRPVLVAAMVGTAYGAIMAAGVLHPPRRQGLHDRLTNVLVLDDRGSV